MKKYGVLGNINKKKRFLKKSGNKAIDKNVIL